MKQEHFHCPIFFDSFVHFKYSEEYEFFFFLLKGSFFQNEYFVCRKTSQPLAFESPFKSLISFHIPSEYSHLLLCFLLQILPVALNWWVQNSQMSTITYSLFCTAWLMSPKWARYSPLWLSVWSGILPFVDHFGSGFEGVTRPCTSFWWQSLPSLLTFPNSWNLRWDLCLISYLCFYKESTAEDAILHSQYGRNPLYVNTGSLLWPTK